MLTQVNSDILTYPLSIVVLCKQLVNPVEDVESSVSPAGQGSCGDKQGGWITSRAARLLPKKQNIVASEVINVLRPL